MAGYGSEPARTSARPGSAGPGAVHGGTTPWPLSAASREEGAARAAGLHAPHGPGPGGIERPRPAQTRGRETGGGVGGRGRRFPDRAADRRRGGRVVGSGDWGVGGLAARGRGGWQEGWGRGLGGAGRRAPAPSLGGRAAAARPYLEGGWR